MLQHKQLTYINSIENVDYFLFKPKLLKCYFTDYSSYQKNTILHTIRMMIELLCGGYSVYYMALDNEIVGYGVVASGGRRLKCSDKKDVVFGPLWVCPEHRGKGLANKLVHSLLNNLGIKYKSAYEYIAKSNTASIKAAEKNGFVNIGTASMTGAMRNVRLNQNGGYFVFRVDAVKQ